MLLLCELTASPTVYQFKLGPESLIQNALELLERVTTSCQGPVDAHIFKYYEEKLHKKSWKRHIGAVHGFAEYLQLRYAGDIKMSAQMLAFSLSVGLNVRECYDAVYKQLGARIFSLMLKQSNPKDIQEMNVHSVIYDQVFKDAYNTTESVEATTATWTCLYLCLDHYTDMDRFAWNQCDDMLDRLIHNVSISSHVTNSICLLRFITKLGYYFTINRNEIDSLLAMDLTQPDKMLFCREACNSLNACTSFRWSKRILQMLVLESDKLLQSVDACTKLLNEMLRCYLVCILPIPLQALHHHLPEFYTKFVAILLECLVVHERNISVAQPVLQFIEILQFQLDSSASQKLPTDLQEYTNALQSLKLLMAQ
ncbi:uncharacterized protein LOC6649661 isoform X2 [Drosophila willistoni]|uniref:uncharacterized protein LOC6649661 isoform X2 n=1 Tax=Drosophila willistoni TaxID=7260 RepID=UPI001F074EFD|nr:uncharacterized protein LOC6649661 isoform X2 [Drosophila willistoni]